MAFKFLHNNFNVLDLEKSLKFYEDALGLKEVRRKVAGDGSFILVYLGDGQTPHQLELTWLRDRKEPYNLGENEFHLAFEAEDYDAAHKKHPGFAPGRCPGRSPYAARGCRRAVPRGLDELR